MFKLSFPTFHLRLGPLTFIKTSVFDAYEHLVTSAWETHLEINYANPDQPDIWDRLRASDAILAEALARVPQPVDAPKSP